MNLLVTGAYAQTEEQLNELRSLGHDVIFMPQENDALPIEPSWVEGIIGNGIFLSHPIEGFSALRYIQLTSAGLDRVPMDYVKANKIAIYSARGVYSIPMAEFAVGGVLELYKQSRFFFDNQKKHIWEKHRTLFELYDKNVCIVGCGSVGCACAERFSGFGCNVIGVDIVPYENEKYAIMLPLSALDETLPKCDIVVLTLPLCEETHHLMHAERFARMKEGALLVNIARGGIVDTPALVWALSHRLGGAVLDAFEDEPLSVDSPLWNMDNVLITPHNSFIGQGNAERLRRLVLENLKSIGR